MTNLSNPIEHFKKEAKKLFKQVKANNTEANCRVRQVLKDSVNISLMLIQHVVAVEYGFLKWDDLIKASIVELHLAITMKRIPLLNDFGIGLYNGHHDLSKEESDAIFENNRKILRESVELITKTIGWLQTNLKPIKTLNARRESYGYKHLAEKDIGYITNGVFIAAAIIAGYPYKIIVDSPNVIFGMSEESIKKIARSHYLNKQGNKLTGTPLGNFFRGPGVIPTSPHLAELADMFDKMTMEEQRLYLNEDARTNGLLNRY